MASKEIFHFPSMIKKHFKLILKMIQKKQNLKGLNQVNHMNQVIKKHANLSLFQFTLKIKVLQDA